MCDELVYLHQETEDREVYTLVEVIEERGGEVRVKVKHSGELVTVTEERLVRCTAKLAENTAVQTSLTGESAIVRNILLSTRRMGSEGRPKRRTPSMTQSLGESSESGSLQETLFVKAAGE